MKRSVYMKICPINVYQNSNFIQKKSLNHKVPASNQQYQSQPTFNGKKGTVLGILGGFALGAGITALTIATGGLAGIVATFGATSTTIAGGAACTHAGGIIGNLIDNSDND